MLDQPSDQRQLAVRLTDIRPEIRTSAAQRCARTQPDKALLLLAAALKPSDTTYFIHGSAAAHLARITTRVERKAA